jgi:putative tryptophan/tyrosine transport system substrate-binding protein
MNTRCGVPRQNSRLGVGRRSIVARGIALATGTLVVARIARAQPAERVRRIGWLSGTENVRPTLSDALRELGWIEGRNLSFETRNAERQRERYAPMAKDLVAAKVELIVAMAPGAIRAAMQATNEVPIVMAWWGGPDLVEAGVIASYARPGGNVTGVDMLLSVLDAKRLDVLHQAVPEATKIAVLIHGRQVFEPQMPAVREVARKAGLTLEMADTGDSASAYDVAFETIARTQSQALLVMASPAFARDRKLIIERAARARVPAIYGASLSVRDGGLISYGTTALELDRQVARQVDRILRGAKPGDLPVEQPSRYETAINLSTAKALGIVIPQTLLLQADQVIE